MSESQAALTVRGVRKTFEAENAPVRALRGVDLTVSEGDFVALMGPSGCGKSTLLNLVAGLDTADEGEISVAGEEVTGRSEDDLAKLLDINDNMVGRVFCALGDTAGSPAASTIKYFRDEYLDHLKQGGCPFDPAAASLFAASEA